MGTLQSAKVALLSVLLVSAGLLVGCGTYDHPCYDGGLDPDYVAVMDEDTEQFLRDYGYVPESECGLKTASFRSFRIAIGTCSGYFDYRFSAEEYSISLITKQADVNTHIGTPIRENLPTADNLFKHYPLYSHCKL